MRSQFKSIPTGDEDLETQSHYVNFPDPQLYLIGFNLARDDGLSSQQQQDALKLGLPIDEGAPAASEVESYFEHQPQP